MFHVKQRKNSSMKIREKILDKVNKLADTNGVRVIGGANAVTKQDAFVVVLANNPPTEEELKLGKQGGVSLSLSGLEMLQNCQDDKLNDLIDARFKNALIEFRSLLIEPNQEQ